MRRGLVLIAAGVLAALPSGHTHARASQPAVDTSTMDAAGVQSDPPFGLDRIDQRGAPLSHTFSWHTSGSDVHVYILSGSLSTTHTTFGGRATVGADFVGTTCARLDSDEAGTATASTVGGTRHGVAKEASLIGVRVKDCRQTTTPARLVAGLDWVTAHASTPAVAVVDASVPADATVDAAARRLIDAGITMVTTSGSNQATGTPGDATQSSPARVGEAITVATTEGFRVNGTTILDLPLGSGNQGPNVDLFSPASTIAIGGGSAEYFFAFLEGAATGFVGGAAALVLDDHPDWLPSQVQDDLIARATTGTIAGPILGSPNRILYVGDLQA